MVDKLIYIPNCINKIVPYFFFFGKVLTLEFCTNQSKLKSNKSKLFSIIYSPMSLSFLVIS